jgi:hypothetical protein
MADKITNEKFSIEDIRNVFSISESRRTIPSLTNEMVFRNPQTQGKTPFEITAPIAASDAVLKPVVSPIPQTPSNKPFEIKPITNNNMADTTLKAQATTPAVPAATTPAVPVATTPAVPVTTTPAVPAATTPAVTDTTVVTPTATVISPNVRVNLSDTGLNAAQAAAATTSTRSVVTYPLSQAVVDPNDANVRRVDISGLVQNLDRTKVKSNADFSNMIGASNIEFAARGLRVKSASIERQGARVSLVIRTEPITGVAVTAAGSYRNDPNGTAVPNRQPIVSASGSVTFGGPNNPVTRGTATVGAEYTNGQVTANGTVTAATDTATAANQSIGAGYITIPGSFLNQQQREENGIANPVTPAQATPNQIRR